MHFTDTEVYACSAAIVVIFDKLADALDGKTVANVPKFGDVTKNFINCCTKFIHFLTVLCLLK